MHRRLRVASRRRVRDARRRLRRPRAAARAIPTRCRRVSWAKLWVFFFERMHSKRARQVARHSRTRRSMSRSPWGESRAACVPSSSSVREMDGCVVARVRASRRNVNDAVDAVHDECAPVRDENGDGFGSLGVRKHARDGGCDDKDVIIRALIDRVTVLEGANDALRAELEEARTRATRLDALEHDEGGAVSTSVSSLSSVSAAAAAAEAAVVGPKTELAESPSRASRRVVWSRAAETMFTPYAVVLSPSAGRAFSSGHGCTTPVSPVRRVRMNDDEALCELEPLAAAFAKCDVSPSGPFDMLCDSSREHDATFEAHVEDDSHYRAREHRSPGARAMNMYESESASSAAEDADDENASPTTGRWMHDAPTTPPSAKPITLKTPMAPLRHQHFRVRGGARELSRIDADADASRPSAECVSPRILF